MQKQTFVLILFFPYKKGRISIFVKNASLIYNTYIFKVYSLLTFKHLNIWHFQIPVISVITLLCTVFYSYISAENLSSTVAVFVPSVFVLISVTLLNTQIKAYPAFPRIWVQLISITIIAVRFGKYAVPVLIHPDKTIFQNDSCIINIITDLII